MTFLAGLLIGAVSGIRFYVWWQAGRTGPVPDDPTPIFREAGLL